MAGCEGCPSHGGPMQKLTPEQKKQLLALQKKQMEIQREYQKASAPIVEAYQELLKDIKSCKACGKTKYRVHICNEHSEKLEAMNKAIGQIQLSFKLKQELDRIA